MRIIRMLGFVAIIIGWGGFLKATMKTEQDYFLANAFSVQTGEFVSYENSPLRMKISNFSGAEDGFRWSNGRKVRICFKPQEKDSLISRRVEIKISPLPELVGRNILVQAAGLQYSNICDKPICTLEANMVLESDISCFDIILPFTVIVPGDDRRLGFKFFGFSYH